jgi:hypothetical protein
MLARVDPTLDRLVILLQDVIEILHRAVLTVVGQIACGLEHSNGGWISGVLPAIFGFEAVQQDLRLQLTYSGVLPSTSVSTNTKGVLPPGLLRDWLKVRKSPKCELGAPPRTKLNFG